MRPSSHRAGVTGDFFWLTPAIIHRRPSKQLLPHVLTSRDASEKMSREVVPGVRRGTYVTCRAELRGVTAGPSSEDVWCRAGAGALPGRDRLENTSARPLLSARPFHLTSAMVAATWSGVQGERERRCIGHFQGRAAARPRVAPAARGRHRGDPLSGGITELPKISIGVDPVTVEPITLNPLTIEPLTINLGPVDLSLSFKEIPSVRVHLPAHFSLGLTVCGRERFCARLCGEAQVITEPYEPNSCEQCEDRTQRGHAAYQASA